MTSSPKLNNWDVCALVCMRKCIKVWFKEKKGCCHFLCNYILLSVCLLARFLADPSKFMPTSFFFFIRAEELLNNFAQQTGAWRHCLFFLSNTRNEYVMMYSLTVFEVSAVRVVRCVISQESISTVTKKQFLLLCKLRETTIDLAVIHLNI